MLDAPLGRGVGRRRRTRVGTAREPVGVEPVDAEPGESSSFAVTWYDGYMGSAIKARAWQLGVPGAVQVVDPADTLPLAALVSPGDGQIVAAPVDVVGIVSDLEGIASYQLEVARLGTDVWRPLAAGTAALREGAE